MNRKFSINGLFAFGIFVVISLFILYAIVTFVGVGLLSILGFEYDSIKTVLLFFLAYFIMSFPIEALTSMFLNTIKVIKQLSNLEYQIYYFIKDMSINIIIISILDNVFTGITIPFVTVVLFSLLSYVLEMVSPIRVGKVKIEKQSNE